jgi:multiple sugar transport system permease protein
MQMESASAARGITATRGSRRGSRGRRRMNHAKEPLSAYLLTTPYLVLLAVAGLIPAVYALVESFEPSSGLGGSVSHGLFANYQRVFTDYRFDSAFLHVGETLLVWLPLFIVIVVGLALLMHQRPGRLSRSVQFILYLPGALAGIANFVLWLFILDPTVSPIRFLAHGFGETTLDQVAQPAHLPIILAAMLIFLGSGTWIVIVYGGLNNIPEDVLEAAMIDGASTWQIAWKVKLPLIRPWIGYLTLINIAYGFQLFLEPSVMSQVTHGVISPTWSPNELSYTYAYSLLDTGGAAALSVILLAVTMLIGVVVILRSKLLGEGRS